MSHLWYSIIIYLAQSFISFWLLQSAQAFTMDRFVIKTKKSTLDDSDIVPENSNSDDNSSQSTVSQKSEQPKRKSVVRKFNSEWESDYFVIENNGKAICLVCRLEFSENRKFTIERHFTSQHSDINMKFLDSAKRATEIVRLKDGIAAEKKIVRKFLDKNEVLTCASYQIAFNLAKSAKPYTDGEFYKSLFIY